MLNLGIAPTDLFMGKNTFVDLAFQYKQFPWIIEMAFQESSILNNLKKLQPEKLIKELWLPF